MVLRVRPQPKTVDDEGGKKVADRIMQLGSQRLRLIDSK